MKYLLPTLAVFAGATNQVMATGWAQYVADWNEDGLRRWRYTYSGISEDNWGQDFLWAIRNRGGITNNWQAYDDEFGNHVFDVNEVSGIGTNIIVAAVKSVTGQNCEQQGISHNRCVNINGGP